MKTNIIMIIVIATFTFVLVNTVSNSTPVDSNLQSHDKVDDKCESYSHDDVEEFVYDIIITKFEGDSSNHKDDNGGRTLWGISSDVQKEFWVPVDATEASHIMMLKYYNDLGIYMLVNKGYNFIALYTLDFAINAGYNGVKSLQGIVGATKDGEIGVETMVYINRYIKHHGEIKLYEELIKSRISYYKEQPESQRKVFGKGWDRRAKLMKDIVIASL